MLRTYDLTATGKTKLSIHQCKEEHSFNKNYSIIDRTMWKVYGGCVVWSVKNRITYNQKGKRDFEM